MPRKRFAYSPREHYAKRANMQMRGDLGSATIYQTAVEEEAIQRSIKKNIPYGSESWTARTIKDLGVEKTWRAVGRKAKNGG